LSFVYEDGGGNGVVAVIAQSITQNTFLLNRPVQQPKNRDRNTDLFSFLCCSIGDEAQLYVYTHHTIAMMLARKTEKKQIALYPFVYF
jgi:hypothetical protein